MNELLIQNLLLDRYQTQFLGLLRKITLPFADIYPANSMKGRQGRYAELSSKPCSYSNNLANARTPANGKVSSPIKIKIQNAINRALQGDVEESGVIVVGGRRRNRKKRPNKNKNNKNVTPTKKNKKNKKHSSGSNSDSSDKENGHSFSIYAAIKAASVGRKTDDQKPLIEGDGKEFDDRDGDSGFWTPDTENDENTDTMPFGFGKKKSAPVIDKKPEPPVAEPPQKVEPVEQVPVKKEEVVKSAEDADAGDNTSQQAIVSMKETTSAPEETNTEMVPSDAVDGGADQQLGNEPVEQKIEDQIEIQEKTVENASKSPDETVEKAEKEETVKAEVPTAKEPEVIEQDVVDCEKELVAATDHVADLAVTQEVMSVDLNELEDDFEVVILDRFELLGKPVVEQMPVDSIAEKTAVEPPIPVVEKQTKKQPRVESTPLIGKQTKVKDTQPGFLCCTII